MPLFDSIAWANKPLEVSQTPRCGACGLYKHCQSPKMPPSGKGKRSILIVGEAPGETEDKQGVQFVGKAGECLRGMMQAAGCKLDNCYITNSIICRPPENVMDDLYIDSCRPNLLNTIRELQPKVIVLLGYSAVKSLLAMEWGNGRDLDPMSKWIGWTIPSQKFNAWICPTYHPSFVMRTNDDPVLVRMVTEHLRKALSLENQTLPRRTYDEYASRVEIITNPRLANLRLKGLIHAEGQCAMDYETTGLKPERPEQEIFSVSFCLNGDSTFACRLDESCLATMKQVIQNPRLKMIASNMKFEERWSRIKLGSGIANWHWDTMLASHVIDNRGGITSIKFQTYIHLGLVYNSLVAPYLEAENANDLNRIKEAPLEDVLKYNGLDSLIEYEVAQLQMGVLDAGR
jgi:uracil-DNA glycosylase